MTLDQSNLALMYYLIKKLDVLKPTVIVMLKSFSLQPMDNSLLF